MTNLKKAFNVTSLMLCLALTTAPTHALPILAYPALAIGAHSLYTHYFALPYDGPNHYDLDEVERALKDFTAGIETKKSLKTLHKNLHYLYIEGLCGHASRLGSPRFNDKAGVHEIPFVPSRGVYGWISDRTDPILKTAEFVGKAAVYLVAIETGYQVITKNDVTSLRSFLNKHKSYKPVTKVS